jgi:twitching motility two-component system response regulator PilH
MTQPLAPEAPLAEQTVDRPAAAGSVQPGAALKIMVVDDSPAQRHYLADLLTRRGYVVTTAENGTDALAKIRADRPALVLMDVVMPGANGFQVTRALVRDPDTREIPVILCTSKSADTDRIWGMRQGARGYLVKPVDAEELLAKIADLVH